MDIEHERAFAAAESVESKAEIILKALSKTLDEYSMSLRNGKDNEMEKNHSEVINKFQKLEELVGNYLNRYS